jgi:hypothetical protein
MPAPCQIIGRMAKRKPPQQDDAPAPKKPARDGVSVQFWMDPELRDAADAYRNEQRYPVSRTALIETALKELLQREGRWPPKAD